MTFSRYFSLLYTATLVCASCVLSSFGATPKSALVGVWGFNLPGYGWIALRIDGDSGSKIGRADLWWLVAHQDYLSLEDDHDTLVLSRVDHEKKAEALLYFTLTEGRKLKLLPGGVFPNSIPAPFGGTELELQPPDFWRDLVFEGGATGEWKKWHQDLHGPGSDELGGPFSLKPLPVDWSVDVVAASIRLARDNDERLHRCVELPATSSELLSEVYTWTLEKSVIYRNRSLIRQTIAAHPHCDFTVLEKIWLTENDPMAWRAAVFNSKAKPEWRKLYVSRVQGGTEQVKTSAAGDPAAPPEIFAMLLHGGPHIRGALAYNHHLPLSIFEELAGKYGEEVGLQLAENPTTPASIIVKLVKSANREVQFAIIKNRNVPQEVRRSLIQGLASSARGYDVDALASEVTLSAETLDKFSNDFNPKVRAVVATNSSTGVETLKRLAQDNFAEPAKAAREALQKRFAGDFVRLAPSLVPIDRLDSNTDYWQGKYWSSALVAGDLAKLKQLVEYFADRRELDDLIKGAVATIVGSFRPELLDVILTRKDGISPQSLGSLVIAAAGNDEWLVYFKEHKVLAGRPAYYAYQGAISSRVPNPRLLPALIKAGANTNEKDAYGTTPLHVAIRVRNLDAVRLLLEAGAKADIPDDKGQTALDYAVNSRLVPAIILLDKNGKYRSIVERFSKEFPSAPNSPFLGQWTNSRDGFSTVIIKMDTNGTGVFASFTLSGLLAWREVSETEAIAYFFDEKGEPYQARPLRFKLHEKKPMTVEIEGVKEVQSMTQMKE